MWNLIMVAIGGSIGASLRYIISLWAAERFGSHFPFGTLFVNVLGCFIIGFFMTVATERFIVNPYWRLLITVGFLGGLTTFSSFSYETLKLLSGAEVSMALLNIVSNIIIGMAATWLGIGTARWV